VSGSAHRGAVAVEQAVGWADDPVPLGPATAAAAGAKLKDLLRQAGVKPAPVLLTVGRDRVILKDVRHPPTGPAEEPAVVRFQAVRDLPESPDDVVMDYVPLGTPTPAGDKRATAVFVRKEILAAARTLCEAAGLKLAGVTPRPFAVVAALRHAIAAGKAQPPDTPGDPVAAVTVWEGGGEFTVVRGDEVTFTRPVSYAATESDATLAQEVRRNLSVYGGQHPSAPVAAVYVAEPVGPPGTGGLADRLTDRLPIPIRSFDPLAGAPAADLIPASLRSRFAAPVGLLSAKAADALPINFVTVRQPRAERQGTSPRLLLGVLAAVLLLGMLGVLGYLEVDKADARLNALLAAKASVDADLDRQSVEVKRLAAADEFANREVVVLDELFDLAAAVPDVGKVGVVNVTLTALAPPAKKDTRPAAPPAPGQPPAIAPKPKEEPVAGLVIVYRTQDEKLAQPIIDRYKQTKGYVDVTQQVKGGVGSDGRQQNVLIAKILRRPPSGYTQTLPAAAAAKAPAPAPADDAFGGFAP
jgi:Tfp pilus assembly PilM family ATPase